MISLRTKLVSSFIIVVLLSVALISVLANLFLEKHFQDYIRRNQERLNQQVAASIGLQYEGNGRWNEAIVSEIGINALEQGLILKVTDLSGKVIWDATVHNNGLCQEMIGHMARNMSSRYPNWKGGYVEADYPVFQQLKQVGTVEVGYYGPIYFNDHDLAFINTLNQILFGVAILALFAALVVGVFIAKRLSAPIAAVTTTATDIAHGFYRVTEFKQSNVIEINQLTSAIVELAQTLEKQELLRKQLTADVAHELRTPLATLQSHIEAILDGIWKPEPDRLKVCHEEVLRLNRMVMDLAKLAKYESPELVLEKTQFDLAELSKQLLVGFESEFLRKQVKLEFEGEPVLICADRDKLSQVIVNLVANALKFTAPGGNVTLRVVANEQLVEIRISDNGSGIAAADLPYIFERFYRADKSRNRLTGGSGIGLAIARAIVEAHGGMIQVRSELNIGTEFTVSLPYSN